jgi:enoyl-CoA hydratase/carnithine racemase
MDLYGDIDGCLGVIKMNKEHNYNMLTPNFINEIQRGIQSMDADQIVSTIFMAPHRGKMWSNGTDFRALAQMQKEGSADAIAAYFT